MLLGQIIFSLEKGLFRFFAHFSVGLFVFLLLHYKSSLYILDIFCKYFLPFSGLSFHFLSGVAWSTKIQKFVDVQFFFLAAPCSMWDLSSPSRDRTRAPCMGARSLNHWTAREVPWWCPIYVFFSFVTCAFDIMSRNDSLIQVTKIHPYLLRVLYRFIQVWHQFWCVFLPYHQVINSILTLSTPETASDPTG